jgi:hypothetical protein
VRNNSKIIECQSCKFHQTENVGHKTVKANSIEQRIWRHCDKVRNSPFSETTVSLAKAWIWSRLNISGLGSGKGTLFKNNSLGVANAWN